MPVRRTGRRRGRPRLPKTPLAGKHQLAATPPFGVSVCAIGPTRRMLRISLSTCSPAGGGAGSLRSSEMRSRTEGVAQPRSLVSVGYSSGSPLQPAPQEQANSPQLALVEDVLRRTTVSDSDRDRTPFGGRNTGQQSFGEHRGCPPPSRSNSCGPPPPSEEETCLPASRDGTP